jgi:hypothetical protein
LAFDVGGAMKRLIELAAARGISVHVAHLPAPYRGYFDPIARCIVIDFALTADERRTVLAHELGHAHYGHECEDDDASERQADIFAARLLIAPKDYAEIERFNPDRHHIAAELNVTVDLVDVFDKHVLSRLRGVTYASPRMGLGQWTYRSAHG